MRKLMIPVLAALMMLATSSVAQHHRSGRGFCAPEGHRNCMAKHHGIRSRALGLGMLLTQADEIGLADEQVGKLNKMAVDFRTRNIDQRAAVQKAEVKLEALVLEDNADEDKVMAAIDDVSRLRAELHKARYRQQQQIRSILTADQLSKVKELRRQYRRIESERGRGWRGMGQGRFFDPDSDAG